MNKKTFKIKTRTVFVCMAMIALIWYANRAFKLLEAGLPLSDTLTVSWFSAWTLELGFLAGIKINDTKNGVDDTDDGDI